ncbi:Putative peptidoglycan binding domain-containing protein [Nitrosomonas cryotolerans]|uniref:Putative peptidoglycan binding domain-containing protein n=1 Tax=Nitrosomonas cryotolerans ATCC 49181 TaxID=1131553 RepID=A0A1N6JE28_9PROT|nr:peptidoglycan-binding domain-containing protein [Nitrosomonas cryotolerans]SFP49551.1 Putative peptidoglycan binding domain-containing protein [Nitrosomonas cryotolerans]SIO42386.1 Putative peptidoglycan binding domain-containing protein [Nitrosomonas cryotolerans ATCC 49181]
MKQNKMSILITGSTFLLAVGLLSGCGDKPEEEIAGNKKVVTEFVEKGATAMEPVAGMDDMEHIGSIEDDGSVITDMYDIVSEKTDDMLDFPPEITSQSIDAMIENADKSIDFGEGLEEKAEIATSPAMDVMQTQPLMNDGAEVVAATPEIIRNVQQALADTGFNPGPADGLNGPRTLAAIVSFQKQNNLVVGQLTKETLRALGVNF